MSSCLLRLRPSVRTRVLVTLSHQAHGAHRQGPSFLLARWRFLLPPLPLVIYRPVRLTCPTPPTASAGVDYVLYGDRWQSAPDHIKAHDYSYMAPLVWSGSRPYIGGGEFAKAADHDMVYWVEGAPAAPTVKHMLDPGACEPCAGINACGSVVTVSDAFLAALPTSAANFSCSMLPSTTAPLPLSHQDSVVIRFR